MLDSNRVPSLPKEIANQTAEKRSHSSDKFDADEYLKQQFESIINELNLTNLQKEFLKFRWLDQILWMEKRGKKSRDWYHRLRLTSIVGGIILPGLLTLSVNRARDQTIETTLYWGTFGLSQVVVISTAIEQLFGHKERWIHYRRSAESLKTQGWQFFQLSGPYTSYKNNGFHQEAFNLFVSQVEEIIQHDVEIYITQTMQKKNDEKSSEQNQADIEIKPASSNFTIEEVIPENQARRE